MPAVLGTATGCEVLRASRPQSINGLEPRIATQPHDTSPDHSAAISIGNRILWPPAVRVSQNPVDLPLRLDDASASPTTPQGLHE